MEHTVWWIIETTEGEDIRHYLEKSASRFTAKGVVNEFMRDNYVPYVTRIRVTAIPIPQEWVVFKQTTEIVAVEE